LKRKAEQEINPVFKKREWYNFEYY
jgi:hypothetical protein